MSDDISLALRNATKLYTGVPAIENVDFELRRGEIHALVGENGAGKSTLTKVMAGVVTLTSGTMQVNGVDVTAYVSAELDRRHPERVQLREGQSAADLRALWDTVERLWAAAVERAGRLPAGAVTEQVNEEWSFAQTLRHLDWFEVTQVRGQIEDDRVAHFQVGLKVGFRLEDS